MGDEQQPLLEAAAPPGLFSPRFAKRAAVVGAALASFFLAAACMSTVVDFRYSKQSISPAPAPSAANRGPFRTAHCIVGEPRTMNFEEVYQNYKARNTPHAAPRLRIAHGSPRDSAAACCRRTDVELTANQAHAVAPLGGESDLFFVLEDVGNGSMAMNIHGTMVQVWHHLPTT